MQDGITIMINNIKWKILFRQKNLQTDGTQCDGYCSYDKYEIMIGDHLSQQGFVVTFWHEIIHAILAPTTSYTAAREENSIPEELVCDILAYSFPHIVKQLQKHKDLWKVLTYDFKEPKRCSTKKD